MFKRKNSEYLLYIYLLIFSTLFVGISENTLRSFSCNSDDDYSKIVIREYDNSEEI